MEVSFKLNWVGVNKKWCSHELSLLRWPWSGWEHKKRVWNWNWGRVQAKFSSGLDGYIYKSVHKTPNSTSNPTAQNANLQPETNVIFKLLYIYYFLTIWKNLENRKKEETEPWYELPNRSLLILGIHLHHMRSQP